VPNDLRCIIRREPLETSWGVPGRWVAIDSWERTVS